MLSLLTRESALYHRSRLNFRGRRARTCVHDRDASMMPSLQKTRRNRGPEIPPSTRSSAHRRARRPARRPAVIVRDGRSFAPSIDRLLARSDAAPRADIACLGFRRPARRARAASSDSSPRGHRGHPARVVGLENPSPGFGLTVYVRHEDAWVFRLVVFVDGPPRA